MSLCVFTLYGETEHVPVSLLCTGRLNMSLCVFTLYGETEHVPLCLYFVRGD